MLSSTLFKKEVKCGIIWLSFNHSKSHMLITGISCSTSPRKITILKNHLLLKFSLIQATVSLNICFIFTVWSLSYTRIWTRQVEIKINRKSNILELMPLLWATSFTVPTIKGKTINYQKKQLCLEVLRWLKVI